MKTIRFSLLAALYLSFSSCAHLPRFDVRVVDSASGAPIVGAEVELYGARQEWPRYVESNTSLGKTDGRGMFGVDGLDRRSTHRVGFFKAGYRDMYVFARIIDGEAVCWINNEMGNIGDSIPLASSPTVEVRMKRGRETTERMSLFSPTTE